MLGHVAQSLGGALPGVGRTLELPEIVAENIDGSGSSASHIVRGAVVGDLMVLYRLAGSSTPPTGLDLVGTYSSSNQIVHVFAGFATVDNPSFTFGSNAITYSLAFSGASGIGQVNSWIGGSNSAGANLAALPNAAQNSLVVFAASNGGFVRTDPAVRTVPRALANFLARCRERGPFAARSVTLAGAGATPVTVSIEVRGK